ncbi:zinc metallochaperone AztD [Paenarthrobacter sp. NPDC089989]|uniref:zinc metallochaperone AztD n=1 Tax=unclassified Paenarthrobacter TaxID=2634190 RepID=UPI00380986F2
MLHQRHTRLGGIALIAGISLLASGCASSTPASTSEAPASSAAADAHGRIAISYPGGISVLDGKTLDVVKKFDTEEFTRLNAAGDGRHVFVTTKSGFQLLDTVDPELTDLVVEATTAGHVVRHAGNTVLFDDGTGTTTILETADLAKSEGALPEAKTYTADAPHHGVSIVLEDGKLITTAGDKTSRTGAIALEPHDGHWDKVAESKDCPGIHGEGTAAGEAVIFGCENGALLFHHGKFEKFTAPDKYGRMGNAFVSETSPIVVGDYKNDPDAEGYLLKAVTLIDTEKHTFNVVDLPETIQYTFRDIARGPGDLAYILSANGSIHVLDPKDGKIVNEFPVIKAWEGPAKWQDAHPAIVVNGTTAYVTEPATSTVHSVDLTTGKVIESEKLDVVPNEIAVTLGAH